MKEQYHRQITTDALSPNMAESALKIIISANLGQDALRYQFGHDHFHYDNNSFDTANAYAEELRQSVLVAVQQSDSASALTSFGQLTHTVQDFYAHSNYVHLWRASHPNAPAEEIQPEIQELMKDTRLHSGKLYYPLEALSFIAFFRPLVLPLLPRDSHAWMNLDAPDRPGFELAFAAAVKRTTLEYHRISQQLNSKQAILFRGKNPL